MIVSSVSGSDVQNNNELQFKGVYTVKGDYSPKQKAVINDVRAQLRQVDNNDPHNRTFEQKLKGQGFDVFMSSSFLKDDAIDVYMVKTNKAIKDSEIVEKSFDGKTIPIGTYQESEAFNTKDIKLAIDDSKKLDKVVIGLLVALGVVVMSLLCAKCVGNKNTDKLAQSKEILFDTAKNGSVVGKNLLKIV